MLAFLTSRVLKRDFDAGAIPENPSPSDLKEIYRQTAVDEIVTEAEWAEALEMVLAWRDARAAESGGTTDGVLRHIFLRFKRFPPVSRVIEVFGTERGERYKASLEEIESDSVKNALFPAERPPYPWKKLDMDAAVRLVVEVIAPHEQGHEISQAYAEFVGELQARKRERAAMGEAESVIEKKRIARSLEIWFPLTKDVETWRTDPRTAPHMAEFERLMKATISRMRLVRSYLQYIPKRRLSQAACKDMRANMERMRIYIEGFNRRSGMK